MSPSNENSSALLDVKELSIAYGQTPIVDGVSFSLGKGEALSIVGESGCGKSTVLRAIAGLLPKNGRITGGQIAFLGQPLLGMMPEERRALAGKHIAMFFQQPGEYFHPTRRIGLQFRDFCEAHGEAGEGWEKRAEKALGDAGFPDPGRIMQSYAFQLSGGMRQRAAAAMTMLLSPELLLADEPTSAMDTVSVIAFLQRMKEAVARGTSIVFVTHHIRAAAYLADRLLIMQKGRAIEMGTTESVLASPSTPSTRQLLEAVPKLR